ncbi:hypothetical protein, partial [Mycobacterium tuberculosis]
TRIWSVAAPVALRLMPLPAAPWLMPRQAALSTSAVSYSSANAAVSYSLSYCSKLLPSISSCQAKHLHVHPVIRYNHIRMSII